jgi:hypothetical protein
MILAVALFAAALYGQTSGPPDLPLSTLCQRLATVVHARLEVGMESLFLSCKATTLPVDPGARLAPRIHRGRHSYAGGRGDAEKNLIRVSSRFSLRLCVSASIKPFGLALTCGDLPTPQPANRKSPARPFSCLSCFSRLGFKTLTAKSAKDAKSEVAKTMRAGSRS